MSENLFADLIPNKSDPSKDNLFADLIPSQTEQKAGSIIEPKAAGKRFLESMKPTKADIPFVLGTTIGGMVGGIPGAMRGGAIGRFVEEMAKSKGLVEGKPSETVGELAGKTALGGAEGLVGEVLGRVGSKVIGKVFSPFTSEATKEAVRIGEKTGVKIPLSSLSESKTVQATERGLEYTPFGQVITRFRQKALDDLGNFAKGVGKRLASDLPAEVQGNIAKKEIKDLFGKYNETTNSIYNSVIPIIKQANPEVIVEATKNKAMDIISRRSGEFEPAGLGDIKGFLERLIGKKVPSGILDKSGKETMKKLSSTIKLFEEMKQSKTNLGYKIGKGSWDDPAVSGLKSDLEELYGAMSEDLSNTVKRVSESAYEDLMTANKMNTKTRELVESKLFNQMDKVKPENVYKLVIIPGMPSQVKAGKKVLGDKFNDVARQWFDDMLNKSSNQEGIVSPIKLAKKLKDYDTVIEEITKKNPKLKEQFDILRNLSNVMSKGRDVTQGSQTGYIQAALNPFYQSLIAIGSLLSGSWKIAALEAGAIGAGMIGSKLGTKAITSDIGRKLLTTGLPTAGRRVGKLLVPFEQLGVKKLSDYLENK